LIVHHSTDYALHATPHRLSRLEYHQLVHLGFFQRKRVELIHGILVDMSPTGLSHRIVVDRLMRLLVPVLAGRADVSIHQPYRAAGESETVPDVSVCPVGETNAGHPARAYLIIEVADSSLEYDQTTKSRLYATSSVEEYWVINLVERVIEIHTEAAAGRYGICMRAKPSAAVAPRAFPDVIVAVDDLLP
jgi:Uma2 family endonuclease